MIGWTAGCVSSEVSQDAPVTDNAVIKEQNSINVAFNKICKLMISGEHKKVYDYYLSKNAQKSQGYEDFAGEYEANKKSWVGLFNGAMLKHIAPEGKVASAVVIWGDGNSSLIEFSKEDGAWKINYLRGPIGVTEGGTEIPASSPK